MEDLPFNEPIVLRSHFSSDLQNLLGMDMAACRAVARPGKFAVLMLHRLDSDYVAIQSLRNDRYLQVESSGNCRFVATTKFDDRHRFRVEMHMLDKSPNHLFFVSAATGKTLQCSPNGWVRCDNMNRLEWEAWTIVEPEGLELPVKTVQDEAQLRREYIMTLAGMNKPITEIQELMALMFPTVAAPLATPFVPKT